MKRRAPRRRLLLLFVVLQGPSLNAAVKDYSGRRRGDPLASLSFSLVL